MKIEMYLYKMQINIQPKHYNIIRMQLNDRYLGNNNY